MKCYAYDFFQESRTRKKGNIFRNDIDINDIFNDLRAFNRRNADSWILYLTSYFRHYERIRGYYDGFWFRRWRLNRYGAQEKTLAQLKNAAFTNHSSLGNISAKSHKKTIEFDEGPIVTQEGKW